jgi:hypothetical protein
VAVPPVMENTPSAGEQENRGFGGPKLPSFSRRALGAPLSPSACAVGSTVATLLSLFHFALIAQLDRASDYGSEGWGFESL